MVFDDDPPGIYSKVPTRDRGDAAYRDLGLPSTQPPEQPGEGTQRGRIPRARAASAPRPLVHVPRRRFAAVVSI